MKMRHELVASTVADLRVRAGLADLSLEERRALPGVLVSFLDAAVTATSRGTYYNSREEQREAVEKIHAALFAIDRGLYAAALALPGVTDYARQVGTARLLSHARGDRGLLSAGEEKLVIERLVGELPPQRRLKLFGELRRARVNNARTRKLILRTTLPSRSLEFWAVKYRRKLASALEHAWGKKTAGMLKAILSKTNDARDAKERALAEKYVGRYVADGVARETAEECARFVLGDERDLTLDRLRSYHEAKTDLEKGRLLPFEVLEGIRGRFHRERPSADALELAKAQLSRGQKMALQRTAREADVEVSFDPSKYDAVRLYLYAMEMGMSDGIRDQLRVKAQEAAARLRLRFERIALVLDASESMGGGRAQKRRPLAVALATRDVLCAAAGESAVLTADGRAAPACELVEARGDTHLASAVVEALRGESEVVFVLSDGYENAPSGRTDEVVHAARRLGVATPIYQMSPVFAAETGSVRLLSAGVPAFPVERTEALGLCLLKAALQVDLERGVAALFAMALPALGGPAERSRTEIEVSHHVR